VNPQKVVNVHHRTLEEYFYENCIVVEGDDIDDEVCDICSNVICLSNISMKTGLSLKEMTLIVMLVMFA
jgi:hypothetical protein